MKERNKNLRMITMMNKKGIWRFAIPIGIVSIGIVLIAIVTFVYFNTSLISPKDHKVGLVCKGDRVMYSYQSGKTGLYKTCEAGTQCVGNSDGSVSCIMQTSTPNSPKTGNETKICPPGTYLGNNGICFAYPGKNLPSDLDYNKCIEDALADYYSRFGATSYTISWITAKTVEDDQYDQSDISWKYIGCSSVRESSGTFITWAVTADCKTGRDGDMMTNDEASNHNICGSERLKG